MDADEIRDLMDGTLQTSSGADIPSIGPSENAAT